MGTSPLDYEVVADGFSSVLTGVRDDQWDLPTPCTDWSVRDLVVHVIETHRRVYGIIDHDAGSPDVGENPVRPAWEAATSAIRGAVTDPARADAMVPSRAFGEQKYSGLVGSLLSLDTLCHTWDLARATAQSEALDPETVTRAQELLTSIEASVRVPGGFGPAITAPDDATAQTKFLNFSGRRV